MEVISTSFGIFVRHLDFPIPKYRSCHHLCPPETQLCFIRTFTLKYMTIILHRTFTKTSADYQREYNETWKKNDVEKWYHRVIWDKLTPSLRIQALIKIISESDSLRWIFNKVLIMFLIYWQYFSHDLKLKEEIYVSISRELSNNG